MTVNNVGNIRGTGTSSTDYNGVTLNRPGLFLNFSSPELGYRAIIVDMRSKVDAYGRNGYLDWDTWAKLYAPRGDGNNPAQYAANMRQMTGLNGVTHDNLSDPMSAAIISTAVGLNEGNRQSGDITAPRDQSGKITEPNANALSGALLAQNAKFVNTQDDLQTQISKIETQLEKTTNPDVQLELTNELNRLKATKAASINRGGIAQGISSNPFTYQVKSTPLNPAVGENPLHNLSNYTYRLIISSLSENDFTQLSSRASDSAGDVSNVLSQIPIPKRILIASGGIVLKDRNKFFGQDFYIPSLEIKTINPTGTATAPTSAGAIATSISMTIVEPIGSTLFERLFYQFQTNDNATDKGVFDQAANIKTKNNPASQSEKPSSKRNNLGYLSSFPQQKYLLTIEFLGTEDSSNKPKFKTDVYNNLTTKGKFKEVYHIPIIFTAIDTEIGIRGTEYRCDCLIPQGQIFYSVTQTLPSAVTIDENTKLTEVLQQLSDQITDGKKQSNGAAHIPDDTYKIRLITKDEIGRAHV